MREPPATSAAKAGFRKAVLEYSPEQFVSEYILEPVPFAFNRNLGDWINWKGKLAALIEVDPHSLVLTGSGATGYSLSPYKALRSFDSSSDLDVAVISSHHFEVAWRFLRRRRSRELQLDKKLRNAIDEHRTRFVYWGTIATDRLLPMLPFAKEWTHALETMSKDPRTSGREVKARIYKDFEALRAYQVQGVRSLQDQLL